MDQVLHGLARLEQPVANQGCTERDHNRALQPDHGIHPFADAGALLEVTRIHEIHAAGPCHLSVHDHDLPMQSQVGAADQGAKQADRQSRPQLDAGVAQPFRLPALPPWPGAERINQYAAADTSLCGPDQGFQDFVCSAAFIPDVELHQHAGFRPVHVAASACSISWVSENSWKRLPRTVALPTSFRPSRSMPRAAGM